jgi:hypothetical protein
VLKPKITNISHQKTNPLVIPLPTEDDHAQINQADQNVHQKNTLNGIFGPMNDSSTQDSTINDLQTKPQVQNVGGANQQPLTIPDQNA